MPDSRTPGTTAVQALDELGRLALHEHSMESLMQRVVDLTGIVMPGRSEASILLMVDGRPSTTAYSGQLALDCDEQQFGQGEGPCLHAATTGELTEVPDMRTEQRWPGYIVRAAERGALSSLSIPLPVSEGIQGALNVYAREVDAFDEESRTAGRQFAPYAGVAVSNMYAYQSAQNLADNLRTALDSRAVIDQAKGILMERHKLTADQAFQVLARVSMQTNTKLRTVADELATTGVLPGLPPGAR
ncbi:GAF and ANTAR domain-containing protein [Blastococcus tunisiensis]|uniref:GAF domain-containing protein n=1 Tax=Blastococcus tunisiensis TaxID=1798228 RepID=A0A1I2J9E5_9ACTN|nr:GAF and ANTAR domain-containing protein [Blastococcus sp. DSM 46838]SFF50620.1 GAF domain-containing protein [Blastococcus sp. DSM 46838]